MPRKAQLGLAALIAVLLFTVLALAIRATPAWVQQPGTPNDVGTMTDALFGPFVIPFEVLGILLTAVMIGALVTARPLTVHGDEETSLVHPNLTPADVPAAPVLPPVPSVPAPAVPPAVAPDASGAPPADMEGTP
jgi:hypothetical protein